MLERIQGGESISRASFRVCEEEGESLDEKGSWDMFKIRMGMRNYFKELKMNQ